MKVARKSKQAAFTLVEALVSMMIIGTAFVSIYGGISIGLTSATWTREQLRAAEIVEEKIEFLRLCNWDQINDHQFVPRKFEEPFSKETTDGRPDLTYFGVIDIKTVPATMVESYRQDLREVTIRIEWNEGKQKMSHEAKTFLSKNGLQNYIPI